MFYDYQFIINDSFTETAYKIKKLSNSDIILISNLDWKPSTYDKITNLLKIDKWTHKDLLNLNDDQRKKLSKIFQQDEILLNQFKKIIEKSPDTTGKLIHN